MIKRRLGFAGILLAGLILVLYLTGGGKIFGRLGVSRCEKLWKESEEVMVEGEVYQKTRKEEKLILYLKKIQIREMGNGKAVADERLLVYLDEKGNGPEIGQRILVKGNVGFFDPAANPGNFDQKNYYKQQNIQAVLWKGKVLEKQVKKTSFREKLWQFRNRTADEICREMGKRRGGILCAVLLGDSFYTEEKVKELYRVAGIGHLLAISGLHISFFGNGLYRGLRKIGFSILQAGVVGSLLLGSYVVMTGMSVSALRAFTMFLIRMGAELTGREYDGLTALGIAESGLLLANPLRLFTAGFQLSFAAVLGIYLIFPEQKYWDERLIKLCNLAEEAGTKVRVMEMDTIFLSGKLKMRCLWPGEGEPSENGNENSLVLHLQYGKITMLFTGDLENTGEELLAERIKNLRKKGELPACYDLLKVGHHGSRNATGEELLEVIRPRAAFCSSGKENRYGHPHAETLERLAKWGVSLYNTKDRGAVSMYTDGREYGIQSP